MRSGGLPGRTFFWRGAGAFFKGISPKMAVFVWCFCGEVVVSRW
jgi:hypothetical protein